MNKVASSGLITIDLQDYYDKGERVVLDVKDNLFMGMVLKEKDFRAFVKETNWEEYQGKNVAIVCSADAVIPTWAYMLLASALEPFANMFVFGNENALEQALYQEKLNKLDVSGFNDARVVVKGCGDLPVPTFAYTELVRKLKPVVRSIMYGEPCSTVPVYKKKVARKG